MEESLNYIVNEVVKRLQSEDEGILVEASGRHVHLSKESVEMLFGKEYKLTKKRELSQPGQYLCDEKVMIIGPKGTIQNISVLGPEREETQIELSKTDAVSIGIKAPVKMSGDIENSGSVIIATQNAAIKLDKGVIVAKRHIHITPEDAKKYGVSNNEEVSVKVIGERGVIFTNVAVRVSDKFETVVHLDYDEANACGFVKGMKATIIK
ncbi:ethanolamine utilization phosphate acetyltransferase EutD [Clostridium sp. OS1-26]|uniref:ethanolamine utilization phosphate acetyltransferase EutD n=1 Tax=Clostridium sp. OS1-26 TaxID=3070681 RepID=UPI0027DFAA1B|nr:ethanolamine utilization phosphate acetyltransferase EutD [Clostridium sp. OS1-26]WML37788.1 ethanolamine utilization phosphate acetyltransferase EutD [Clostridium sp. OS1-26]